MSKEKRATPQNESLPLTESQIWQTRVIQPELLLLDEFAITSPNSVQLEVTERIVDCRSEAGRPLALSSNKSLPEIHQEFGDRIASRLSQGADIPFDGPDLRAEQGRSYRVVSSHHYAAEDAS